MTGLLPGCTKITNLIGLLNVKRITRLAEEGKSRDEVRSDVDSAKLATLIASALEGSLMVSRLLCKQVPLDLAFIRPEEYLETKTRAYAFSGSVRSTGSLSENRP
jgi:hypothetical protein